MANFIDNKQLECGFALGIRQVRPVFSRLKMTAGSGFGITANTN
jgi:hypothetical protein